MHKFNLFSLVLYIYLLEIRIFVHMNQTCQTNQLRNIEMDSPIVLKKKILSLYPSTTPFFLSIAEQPLTYPKKSFMLICMIFEPFFFSNLIFPI